MQLQSTLTCPHCSQQATEPMPTNACQFFYECTGCGACSPARRTHTVTPTTIRLGRLTLVPRRLSGGERGLDPGTSFMSCGSGVSRCGEALPAWTRHCTHLYGE